MNRPLHLLTLLLGACTPVSEREAFEADARAVCSFQRGLCEGGVPLEEPVRICAGLTVMLYDRVVETKGEPCHHILVDWYACAAELTCDEFFTAISGTPTEAQPCGDLRLALKELCADITPFEADKSN